MRQLIFIAMLSVFSLTAMAADLTDYERVAVSTPLISQIYTNPQLSELQDVELSPDAQIKLYEEFGEQICNALKNRFQKAIEFYCLSDIENTLETKNWNDFNRLFTGQNAVDSAVCHRFAEKLNADGVLNTYLMFTYYKDDSGKRFLELHFEWYLVDMASGTATVDDKYDCRGEFLDEAEAAAREMNCFDGIIVMFEDLGR